MVIKILWLSWRDIKNPNSGGAEKVAIEIASRLVKDGSKVTIFSSKFPTAKDTEIIDNVKIIRRGNLLTCRLFALWHYLTHKKNYDLLVDEINTIPFFTPLYAKDKSIALIHQLAREYWWHETFFPLSALGYFFEPIYLKLYKSQKTLALSNSTTHDLHKLGFKKVTTYFPGFNFKSPKTHFKKEALLVFIGRLTAAKKPLDALYAFEEIRQKVPKAKLVFLGYPKPNYLTKIKIAITKLKLDSTVVVIESASENQKNILLKKAKIILIPSVREGWALVATEASSQGCVPIGYNVAGLQDSIKNGQTGLLVKPEPSSLAKAAITLLQNEPKRAQLAQKGQQWSREFSWEKTYKVFKQLIASQNR